MENIKKLFIFILILFSFSTEYAIADSSSNVSANIFVQFLKENNIPITLNEERFIVDKNINENDLLKFFELLFLSSDVIANNIANANTTRTNDGGPFVRNRIHIINGNVHILKDERDTFRLIYDPTHPDAILTGNRAGYVEMPNVDIVSEMVDLIVVSRIFENIIEECLLKEISIPEKYIRDMNYDNENFINEIIEEMQ